MLGFCFCKFSLRSVTLKGNGISGARCRRQACSSVSELWKCLPDIWNQAFGDLIKSDLAYLSHGLYLLL